MKQIRQFYNFLDINEKKKLLKIVPLTLLNSIMEFFSLGIIFSFLSILLSEENLPQDTIIKLHFLENYSLDIIILLIIAIFLIKSSISIAIIYAINNFCTKIYEKVSSNLFSNTLNLKFDAYLKKNISSFNKSISEENTSVKNIYHQILSLISDAILLFAIVLILIFTLEIKYLLVLVLIILLSMLFVNLTKKKLKYHGSIRDSSIKNIYQKSNTYINSFIPIRINKIIKKVINDFSNDLKAYCKSLLIFETLSASTKTFLELILVISLSMFIFYLYDLELSKEEIFYILGIIVVVTTRSLPIINKMIISYNSIRYNYPLFSSLTKKKIFYEKNLDLNQLNFINTKNNIFKNKIELNKVRFNYNKDLKIFDSLSFKIFKGDKIIISGETGSGKSTFLNLIMGLHDPTSGNINIDGKNLRNIRYEWYNSIDYVPQNISLIDETVYKNIIFFNNKNNFKNLKKITEILKIKKILNKRVGENGKLLSGGQIQRIGIARALVRDKDVIIFDETTSAIDISLEKKILKYLFSLNKTIILVTHRYTFKKFIKKYYKLENKKLYSIKI